MPLLLSQIATASTPFTGQPANAFTPTGDTQATNTQDAIVEVRAELAANIQENASALAELNDIPDLVILFENALL